MMQPEGDWRVGEETVPIAYHREQLLLAVRNEQQAILARLRRLGWQNWPPELCRVMQELERQINVFDNSKADGGRPFSNGVGGG